MPELSLASLTDILLAAGALGTAAFGFVEALKWWRFGEYGYAQLVKHLGVLVNVLDTLYSDVGILSEAQAGLPLQAAPAPSAATDRILRTLYRSNADDLVRTLRQGVRAGLTPVTAGWVAGELRTLDAGTLIAAADAIQSGEELSDQQRTVLARYELAADARIDGAVAIAQDHYAGKLRLTAAIFAIVISLIAALMLGSGGNDAGVILRALLVGVLAVPVAPIVHDLVDVLQSITTAIGPKS